MPLKKLLTKKTGSNNKKVRFPLGSSFPGVYLTKREAECIYYLLKGKTTTATGKILGLSRRTVETHINIIKNKLNCKTKFQLIGAILKSAFIKIASNIFE